MNCFSRKIEPGFSAPAESGDAVVFPANCTVVGVPEVTEDRWVKVSFSCFYAPILLRVEIHNGQSIQITTVNVTPEGNRINQAINLPAGANKIAVARLATQGGEPDTPADVFVEWS